ncbi:uncharacterized protein BN574_00855 [Phascolarctobacterium sp. CAG:266]|nr:uncharacterized protein BN574_00855 [Phascolarctobacterium sp. CAG:266]
MNKLIKIMLLLVLAAFCSLASAQEPDYADTGSWAYWRVGENKPSDLFIVCPTVDLGTGGNKNMSLADNEAKKNFYGALNMERGIYEQHCRMYAPYYRQAVLADYDLPANEAEPYFNLAYKDVRAAFVYYMQHENNGRPFVLAGFSQGAEMCLRLLKEFGNEDFVKNSMVACYAIGWRFTPQEAKQYPYIRPTQSADDLGTVIMFNSEAPEVTSSLMVPHGEKSFCINPLNWRTDGTMADKALNSGACFTDYSGSIKREVPQLTGCCIDTERGVLKVTDIDKKQYPPVLSIFTDGIYHLYDYQFFYRNLQQNVGLRINTFVEERQVQNAA